MKKVNDLHREAMALVDQSLIAKLRGEINGAKELLRQAFIKEREAASLVISKLELEPTRSVLLRSAASLALECGEIREAEKLISTALSGQPSEEIAEELRDLFEEVYFQRHLKIRGITLEPNEFQFSMEGKAVGFGIANSDQFIERVGNVEKAVHRTRERLLGLPFRERGRPEIKLQKEFELYVTVPRPSSFAISFRIGRGEQLKLPGMDIAQSIIDELFECLELFNSAKTDLLSKKIQDPSYYRNFVGIARNIAPDGEEIKSVGFTTIRDNVPRQITLTTTKKQAPPPEPMALKEKAGESIQVTGVLLYADARKGEKGVIQIIDKNNLAHRVRVPEGMMSDIVRPLWEYKVTVTGILKDKTIHLQTIEKATD